MSETKGLRGQTRPASTTTVVVGLDFGTTYSGIAWARSTRADQVNLISAWGGLPFYQAADKQKCPSVISYDGNGRVSSWGYGFAPPEEPIKWFKLLLIDERDLPGEIRFSHELVNARNVMKRLNKEPVEVVGDYLRCLWTHTYGEIRKSMGRLFLESCQMKIVATLPAIWPAYAQVRMREAMNVAGILKKRPSGIPELTFISEPEAAALASLHDCVDRDDVKPDDHLVVCDAGGGTVDLITYAISSKEPLAVKESVCGDGALCGAILLDQSFSHVFRKVVGRPTWKQMDPRTIHFTITIEWENGIKRSFDGKKKPMEFILPFGRAANGLPPTIKIQPQKLNDIFTPVAESITALVKKQITAVQQKYQRKPNAVLLVGGLGRSPFLYKYLQKKFPAIPVAQDSGERPWTAVCRGAVIQGLSASGLSHKFNIDVGSKIARWNYGTLLNTFPFEEGKDDPRDRAWCPVQGVFLAVDQVEWFAKMGTPLEEGSVIKTFFQDFEEPENDIEVELVYSSDVNPGKRREPTVQQLCRIKWLKIPQFESLPQWTNPDGTEFRRLTYDIKMTVVGSSLDFAIYYKKRRTASHNVVVEFADILQPSIVFQPTIGQQPCIDRTEEGEDMPSLALGNTEDPRRFKVPKVEPMSTRHPLPTSRYSEL